MRYLQLSTLLVVVTVVLAGCSGGGVPDGTAAPSTDGADTNGQNDGGSASGSDSLSLSAADSQLRAAGSFTTEWSYTIDGTDGILEVSDRYAVDLDANRSVERFSSSTPEGATGYEIFIADGTSYTRQGEGEQAFYQVSEQSPNVFQSATGRASGFYGSLEEDAQRVGRETFDGVSVTRYEYADTSAWQTYNQGLASGTFDSDENVTVTDFEIATLVDDDGIARLTTWTLTGETESGETVSIEWRYSLTDIGSTTVEDPEWLAAAQQQA